MNKYCTCMDKIQIGLTCFYWVSSIVVAIMLLVLGLPGMYKLGLIAILAVLIIYPIWLLVLYKRSV